MRLQAKGEMPTPQMGKLCYNTININIHLWSNKKITENNAKI